jgi:hypothetical protein
MAIKKEAPDAVPKTTRMAYHAGPPDIQFCGRRWARGVAQPLTQAEQAEMRARPDFKQFNFIKEV